MSGAENRPITLCEEWQQLNFGPPRRGSRGAFTAGLASFRGWEEVAVPEQED